MTTLQTLDRDERLDWLCLFRSENVGPITFHRLIARCGGAKNALARLPDMAARGGKRIQPYARDKAEAELDALEEAGGFMLASCEPGYPRALAAIEDAPPVVSVLGRRDVLDKPRRLAMVGSRNASLNGRQFAERLARDCGQAGFTIVSGLARGIDAAAHRGGLAGGTIAVLGCGVDIAYPEENRPLYEEIREAGALVSECVLGAAPSARQFPRRNRIISGLSEGVVVVEAVQASGSLITARLALEQGREVFAVPGSPLDPRCAGTNNLLRQGARMAENAQDVINELEGGGLRLAEPASGFTETQEMLDEADINHARAKLLEILGPSPLQLNDVIRDAGLPVAAILVALLELELAGKAERQPGGHVCLLT